MGRARRDGYTPNLFEIWRGRQDLERDSRSLSGKDDGLPLRDEGRIHVRESPLPPPLAG